ncbi:MAG: hypothetical protein ACOCSJ_02805 [Candidatus Natronoplasma sp.]
MTASYEGETSDPITVTVEEEEMEGSEESMETITATGESTALKGEDDFHNP